MKRAKAVSKVEALAKRVVGGSISQMATYSDLFENMNDAIFLVDPDTARILECNPAAERLLGVSPARIQGDELTNWVASSSRELLEENLNLSKSRRRLEKPFDVVFVSHPGTELVLEISAHRLSLADYCEVVQIVAKDVTTARSAARALDAANRRLARLSNTDEMTGLCNFRYLKAELERVHARALSGKMAYSIILCDIDHFKNFNDTNGHLEGDEALKQVAIALKEASSEPQLVARYGGEEFVVLCPGGDGPAASQRVAEAFRRAIESRDFAHGAKQPLGRLTVSIGVASFPEHGSTTEEILRAADTALYRSKELGRNRVSVFVPKAAVPKKAA